MESFSIIFIVAFFLLVSRTLYRLALPKPIPGIPRNENLGILGDIPRLMNWQSNTQEVYSFLTSECVKLRTPIAQLFLRPLGKPWIVVTDPEVAKEVMTSRLQDFDRSSFFKDVLHGIVPHNHAVLPTNDAMKTQRKLMADTMSPGFLNDVAAEHIHVAVEDLIEVWKAKIKVGGPTKAFKADADVKHGVFDAIWGVAFGNSPGTSKAQLVAMSENPAAAVTAPDGLSTDFTGFKPPPAYRAIDALGVSVEKIISSPFPKHHHWILRQFPSLSGMIATKEKLVSESLQEAAIRAKNDTPMRSAADLVLARAAKTGKADINSPIIRDELAGFLVAGHETSATTLAWAMKYLSDYKDIQQKLREAILQHVSGDRQDFGSAIARLKIPYLEAFVEETCRLGNTQSAITRVALRDTTLMGYAIPKGADVFFMTNGPGYKSPSKNSGSEKKSIQQAETMSGLEKFDPERWLVYGNDGQMQFNSNAAPNHIFGAGFRGCFGRKLAYLELRIFIAALVLAFEFLPADKSLSTYAAVDQLNHHPQQCYVHLKPLNV